MKKQINPAFMVVALVIVVAGVAALLYKAANDKPTYPGMNAPHPAGEVAGAGGKQINGPTGGSMTYEQAKNLHISGMAPGAKPPQQSKIPGQ
jgi:hypothetical protein